MKKKVVIKSSPSLKDASKRNKTPVLTIKEPINVSERLRLFANGRSYFVRTYGCQANVLDGQTIEGILREIGFKKSEDHKTSDIVILNTCAIRENAEEKVFGEIGSLKQLKASNPRSIIAISGCMVQQEHIVAKIQKTYPQVDLVFGTHNINNLANLLDEIVFNNTKVIEVFSKEGEVIESLPCFREDKIKAFVNIMYGCDKFCTYCIVPYTRGKQRSRMMEEVINECAQLVKEGYQEITLLGQNVNAYGKDIDPNLTFAELLEEVAKLGIPRLRFTTSHPWDFTEEMFKVISTYPNVMPAIHLPLQSGSADILRRMGRRYTPDEYKALVDKLRQIVPDASISTDIIVGFPNETEEDFNDTLEMVKYCHFDSAFTFIYSPRVGTPAARIKDYVTDQEKHRRFDTLVKVVNEEVERKAKEYIGKVVEVLVEGKSKKNDTVYSGYTDTLKLVNFTDKNNNIGKIIKVKIIESHTFSLIGEAIYETGN